MAVYNDFVGMLFAAAGVGTDSRFRNWAKTIEGVDSRLTNGFCFIGQFVKSGTVEIAVKPQLFLVAGTTGSMRYHHTTYAVVEMTETGELKATGLQTDDKTDGWALRLRDAVLARLAEIAGATPILSPLAEVDDQVLIVELQRRGYTVTK